MTDYTNSIERTSIMTKIQSMLAFVLIVCVSFCHASDCCKIAPPKKDVNTTEKAPTSVEEILLKLNKQNAKISTYQAKIDYLYTELPDVVDSTVARTGNIYYKKTGKASKLIIKFDTFKQDDEKTEKRRQQFFFDGVWLKVIDYKNKTINSYQKALEKKPIDAFELISRDFPMLGFNNKENLRKDFTISISKDQKDGQSQIGLNLKVKKGSKYAKNYTFVDLRIDKKTFLPARIITTSTEGDIYDIKLHVSKNNKILKDSVFKLETPADFRENKHPIEKK
jgi:hypothetical protein